MLGKTFFLPVRIYFEDTDAGGIVYHSNYLRYMERARGELLRELGFDQQTMLMKDAPLIVVSKIDIHYRRPARLDDLLTVHTTVKTIRRASVIFSQVIKKDDDIITEATVRCASIDVKKGVPVMMPKAIYDAFLPLVAQPL